MKSWGFVVAALVTCTSGSALGDPSSSPTPSAVEPREHAQEVLARADIVHELADKAVQLDGTTETAQLANKVMYCRLERNDCVTLAKNIETQSTVAGLAGLAAYLANRVSPRMVFTWINQNEPDVALAETLAKRALAEAQKVADAHAQRQARLLDESGEVDGATRLCNVKPALCESRCQSGDGPACVAWGSRLWNGPSPKLADARAAMSKGCDAGTETACSYLPQIDADIRAAQVKTDGLWDEVKRVGDDIAVKRFQVDFVRKYANSPHNRRGLINLTGFIEATVNEKYCPARRAFVANGGLSAFVKRATAHCKDEPPVGEGLSGAEVTLTAQCQTAFATPCP